MKTILVVEDDLTHVKIISDLLTSKGYRIRVAQTGPEGVQQFLDSTPDLMLVDINLPEKTGYDVAAEIRATPEGERMPVILMSAVPENTGILLEAKRLGVPIDGYLSKPFRLAELLQLVHDTIGVA